MYVCNYVGEWAYLAGSYASFLSSRAAAYSEGGRNMFPSAARNAGRSNRLFIIGHRIVVSGIKFFADLCSYLRPCRDRSMDKPISL
jgi:hypothetical protein